jgi:hypothetical protein
VVFGHAHPCFYSEFDFEGAANLRSMLSLGDILVHSEVRDGEYHEGQIGGLTIEVRVSASWFGLVMDFAEAIYKWGRHQK